VLEKIISNGQTGLDQAGWRAARAAGIPTGGWMPKGFLTEDGPHPEFAEDFGALEWVTSEAYPRHFTMRSHRRVLRDGRFWSWVETRALIPKRGADSPAPPATSPRNHLL
jgi:hypothetical protein